MRLTAATVQKFLLGMALLAGVAWNVAYASEIKGLQLSSGATGTRAEIVLDSETEFTVISLASPHRLVVDLPASSLGKGVQLPAGTGVVSAVRSGQPTAGTARIVFDLVQPVAAMKPRLEQGASGPRLVLEWPGEEAAVAGSAPATPPTPPVSGAAVPGAAGGQSPAAAIDSAASAAATTRLISELAARVAATPPASTPSSSAPASARSAHVTATVASATAGRTDVPTTVATGVPTRIATGQPTPALPPAGPAVKTVQGVMQAGMRELVIAIDPGHGGQDPGAIGPNGTREKDVVLEISKELARQINATPGLRAVLTRDSDVFIPLNRRATLARQGRADMFISIHADAAENRNADGSSVYVLSLRGASSQRARWLADKENSSDLVGGVRLAQTNDTLASVLLDLTQSGHMKASEDAASEILDGLKRIGNIHKPNIERANFAVLRTSDMPSMLVETAFISNPEEERRLRDPAFRRKLAGAVVDGVHTFFSRQPPPGTMYAARAAAELAPGGAAGGSP